MKTMNRYQLRRRSYHNAAAFFGAMSAICATTSYGFAFHGSPVLSIVAACLSVPHLLMAIEMGAAASMENRKDRATRNHYL